MKWLVALGLVSGVAHAEMPRGVVVGHCERPIATGGTPGSIAHAEPSSRLIFLHRCPSSGCLVHQGEPEDSRSNTSSIADGERVIGRFAQGDAVWDGLVSCMRATYAPFDVTITDVDPGPTVPHFEHIVGGKPGDLRPDIGFAGGVAPATCTELPNAITYTFDVYGKEVDYLCWTAAQETAHAFGLDHEILQKDPLTYADGNFPKRFQPEESFCGESGPRQCACTMTKQSSYNTIMALFGPGIPTPPTVMIKSPAEGTVQPTFLMRVTAMDDVEVDRVELWIDGVASGVVATEMPYFLRAPDGVTEGPHHLEARAYDIGNAEAIDGIDVDVGPPCTAAAGCEGKTVCVMGNCVPGPAVPGGLGDTCGENSECLDFHCVAASDGRSYCVEACDGDDASCPSGFECADGANLCVALPDAGCCSTGGDPRAAIGLSLAVAALLRRRRS